MQTLVTRKLIGLCSTLAGCVAAPPATTTQDSRGLAAIEHVVVVYAENRSFDDLYGLISVRPGNQQLSIRREHFNNRISTATCNDRATNPVQHERPFQREERAMRFKKTAISKPFNPAQKEA
jgi:phospholipase C